FTGSLPDQYLKPGRVTVNANRGKGYLVPIAGKHIPAQHAAQPEQGLAKIVALTGPASLTPELPIFPGAVGSVRCRRGRQAGRRASCPASRRTPGGRTRVGEIRSARSARSTQSLNLGDDAASIMLLSQSAGPCRFVGRSCIFSQRSEQN